MEQWYYKQIAPRAHRQLRPQVSATSVIVPIISRILGKAGTIVRKLKFILSDRRPNSPAYNDRQSK